ncbi:DUF928 domain-containing protein [Trichocoleus sp. FACHB-262]|uniref:DUF928 domain-containing protein n=1 Tax=Trichocoleus sp. FACHB-262 TaxID=2692869 RepID=UPI001A7EE74D|nr:DUF928 domain-containing protein [Trichocoleus sp. FACHB-262]
MAVFAVSPGVALSLRDATAESIHKSFSMLQVNISKTFIAAGLMIGLFGWVESSFSSASASALQFRATGRKLPGRRVGAGTRAFVSPRLEAPGTRGTAPVPRLPGRRQGAGSRGPSSTECLPANSGPLVALLPTTNLGLTTAAYPQFFWSLPASNASLVEFALYDVDAKQVNRNLIYKTTFSITGEAGIASLNLPTDVNLPPLKSGQDYRWSVSLICNPGDRTQDVTVDGWVQRVTPSSTVNQQLKQADPRDRPAVYAQNGIWFNTIETLVDQRCDRPKDAALVASWNELIKSVELEAIANRPLICVKDEG